MRENVNVYGNTYVLMFKNIYVFIFMYKCLNEKKKCDFLDFIYVEKIWNDYGFHSFIKHDLWFPY